ncbi:hypothetical protein BELL_0052g00290 [Botrytis elliptica]|uniref:Uncharacterized protein n=1 Tax=Botrytis elliptica TaxID=278938 RepID=A0A4Z1K090_9HELO|nr:hypothetical protein BELL_0052g00290 [Botrytis elliptica]
MSQEKRPDQGDVTDQSATTHRHVTQIYKGAGGHMDLNNLHLIKNPFPQQAPNIYQRYDYPGRNWEIVIKPINGVETWVTVDRDNHGGGGKPVTREQQIQLEDWEKKMGFRETYQHWPIIEDCILKSDWVRGREYWTDPNYIAWNKETLHKLFPPNTSTTSHGGGVTHSVVGSQYSSGDQYTGGEGSSSGAVGYYTGGAQYPGGGGSNSGAVGYYTGGAQYPGGESSNSGGDQYPGGEGSNSGAISHYTDGGQSYDPTTDTSEGGRLRQNRPSGTPGRGAGSSGHHGHRQKPY